MQKKIYRRFSLFCVETDFSFNSNKVNFFQDLQNHVKIAHCAIMDIKQDTIPAKKIKITNKNIVNNDSVAKDFYIGGPLLLTNLDQESLDNSNQMLGQTSSKQLELNSFIDHNNELENEHLNLNVDSILLTDNVKELDHFNFELNETESEQLVCDLCLKSFEKVRQLITHLAQHTGKHTCLECNKVFKLFNKMTIYNFFLSNINFKSFNLSL